MLILLLLGGLPLQAAWADTTVTEVEIDRQISDGNAQHSAPAGDATAQVSLDPDDGPAVDPAAAIDSTDLLLLQEALQRAVADHPGLAALRREQQALGSEAWQQGRKPNPEVEIELEEFGGTDEASGFSSLASSITYTQPLERGGKRSLREMTARLESELIAWDIAQLEHEIQSRVRRAYAGAQVSQYALEQLAGYRALLQHIYETVAARVDAGRSARLELERLDIELARLDLQLDSADRSSRQALQELAAACGRTVVDFQRVEVTKAGGLQLESLSELQLLIDELPAIARYDAEYLALGALLELENANSVSDLALFGGITRLNEIQETVFKVGVAWELPIHDRNEGTINAAFHRRENVAQRRAASRLELETELAVLHSQAGHAQQNYLAYSASLLPAASEALALTEEGYRYGKFDLLDVLDAQRTVLELESEQTAALTEYILQLAEIEALLNADMTDWVAIARQDSTVQPLEMAMAGTPDPEEQDNDNE